MKKKDNRGRPKKMIRNKMIVILRDVAEVTKDDDLSVRNIGKELNIVAGTMSGILKRDKKRFTVKKYFQSPEAVHNTRLDKRTEK